MRPAPVSTLGLLVAGGLCLAPACDRKALDQAGVRASASASPSALPPELASRVLARVGERTITLGDYAAALDRMDSFERLRYQTPERKKQLLDEMIRVELLADEARRRGLDQKPEHRERLRQILRDELLREVRAALPSPADLPEAEVRALYERTREEYREPERRRVAVIVLTDEAKAKRVLELARKATPAEWGRLVREHSVEQERAPGATAALELMGDLGIVSPPGEKKGENPQVPEAVRVLLFRLEKLGDVAPELAKEGGRFYVVRLTGKTDARDRSFTEAERTLRIALLQERLEQAEERLLKDLRARHAVRIDEAALGRVTVPPGEVHGNVAPPAASR